MPRVVLYSPVELEPWSRWSPWMTGIGGSETSHIEIAERLSLKCYAVHSYAPVPNCEREKMTLGVWWSHYSVAGRERDWDKPSTWLVYRDPVFFDEPLGSPGSKYWFIAQDVDYQWTPERLAKVDRYICLCPEHVRFTVGKYPQIKDRVYLSSNGIRSSMIRTYDAAKYPRNLRRLMYASSPDRGLLLILQNWFRIRERVPDAELHVFYGFNTMEAILEKSQGQAWFVPMKQEIERLLKQDGVIWRGRVGQAQLYEEWFRTGIWFYPTNWPETSAITCMDAQACGAIPVTNKYWALEQNILAGVMLDGVPQDDNLTRAFMLREVCDLMLDENLQHQIRGTMMEDARDTFDWQRIVEKQIIPWVEEDQA